MFLQGTNRMLVLAYGDRTDSVLLPVVILPEGKFYASTEESLEPAWFQRTVANVIGLSVAVPGFCDRTASLTASASAISSNSTVSSC